METTGKKGDLALYIPSVYERITVYRPGICKQFTDVIPSYFTSGYYMVGDLVQRSDRCKGK